MSLPEFPGTNTVNNFTFVPSKIYEDNSACIVLATTTSNIKLRTKHIDIYHFKDQVNIAHLQIVKVATDFNLTDILTKPLLWYSLNPFDSCFKVGDFFLPHAFCHTREVAWVGAQLGYDFILFGKYMQFAPWGNVWGILLLVSTLRSLLLKTHNQWNKTNGILGWETNCLVILIFTDNTVHCMHYLLFMPARWISLCNWTGRGHWIFHRLFTIYNQECPHAKFLSLRLPWIL